MSLPDKYFDCSMEHVAQLCESEPELKQELLELLDIYFERTKQIIFKEAKPDEGAWTRLERYGSDHEVHVADQLFGGFSSLSAFLEGTQEDISLEKEDGAYQINCKDLDLIITWLLNVDTNSLWQIDRKGAEKLHELGARLAAVKKKYTYRVIRIYKQSLDTKIPVKADAPKKKSPPQSKKKIAKEMGIPRKEISKFTNCMRKGTIAKAMNLFPKMRTKNSEFMDLLIIKIYENSDTSRRDFLAQRVKQQISNGDISGDLDRLLNFKHEEVNPFKEIEAAPETNSTSRVVLAPKRDFSTPPIFSQATATYDSTKK